MTLSLKPSIKQLLSSMDSTIPGFLLAVLHLSFILWAMVVGNDVWFIVLVAVAVVVIGTIVFGDFMKKATALGDFHLSYGMFLAAYGLQLMLVTIFVIWLSMLVCPI